MECKLPILIGTFIVLASVGQGDDVTLSRVKRVIGGETLSRDQSPWLVWLHGKIVTQRLFGFLPLHHRHVYCGGSLLNSQWILTAAHCFDGGVDARDVDSWEVLMAANDNKVVLADRFMDFLGRTLGRSDWLLWEMGVSRIILHPGYTGNDHWYQDIALVRLASTVNPGPDGPQVAPVQLPAPRDSSFPALGDRCQIMGWGCTSAGGGISRYAQSIELPILEDRMCESFYRTRSMYGRLCAGFKSDTSAKGICPGDSGGPLMCRTFTGETVQVGIASFTSRDSPERFPAVFTRVSDYVDWIRLYTRI
ncbi:serine protease 1-like [Dreissena polymorpha]|uniref:Peptidase S1 domain-containing protein n=1 Tax=Dreissena polymorpha TaxID=45954 RepID=A0A9D4H5D6_DREPO|nr:serine protease 1-like [Dreissena polymorpha]KAH3827306.1 hypothetical protein DPMN_129237 [Dreissena polymorpha]